MAEPKTGNSHTRGSQFIGSGLYVTGVLRAAGAARIGGTLNVTGASHLVGAVNILGALNVTGAITLAGSVSLPSGTVQNTDIATGSNGFLYSHSMKLVPNSGAVSYTSQLGNKVAPVVSGQAAFGLRAMAPGIGITIRGVAFAMQTAPGGTGLRVQLLSIPSSGSVVHKGYVTTKVSKIAVYKSGLSATIPAGNAYGFALNRNGSATSSGTQLSLSVYYTRS